MSTRTQIRFEDETQSKAVQIYQHADGFPDDVIYDLKALQVLQRDTDTQRGATYTAANYLFQQKLRLLQLDFSFDEEETEQKYNRKTYLEDPNQVFKLCDLNHRRQSQALMGYGVENPEDGIHGDENYLYKVILPDWKVKVATDLSMAIQRDDEQYHPFEQVEWEFEGHIDEAVEKYT